MRWTAGEDGHGNERLLASVLWANTLSNASFMIGDTRLDGILLVWVGSETGSSWVVGVDFLVDSGLQKLGTREKFWHPQKFMLWELETSWGIATLEWVMITSWKVKCRMVYADMADVPKTIWRSVINLSIIASL